VAMPLVERIFCADSEAVIDLLDALSDENAADERWRLAVLGFDFLAADFSASLEHRRDLARETRQNLDVALEIRGGLDHALGRRFRRERLALEELFDVTADSDHPLAPGVEIFERRSATIRPIVTELAALHAEGLAARSPLDILPSVQHMFADRLLRSEVNTQELVLADYLARLYTSRLARGLRAR